MKKVYISICGLWCCILLCGCGDSMNKSIEDGKKQMTEFITNEAIPEFNQKSGINDITISGIIFEEGYELSNTAQYDCKVNLASEEIEKFSSINNENQEEVKELLEIFRSIDSIRDSFESEKYHYIIGKNEIGFNFLLSDHYNTIIINGVNGNVYEYGTDTDYEHLYLNSDILFEELGENYGKRSYVDTEEDADNQYAGAYDAKLKDSGTDGVLICASEDAMERFMTAVINNNEGTLEELFLNGQCAYTEQGTKCNIVDRKLTKCQVKLLDGTYAGETVWVVIEALQEK